MEDDHTYIPTPTLDQKFGSCHVAPHYPGISEVGGVRDPTFSCTTRATVSTADNQPESSCQTVITESHEMGSLQKNVPLKLDKPSSLGFSSSEEMLLREDGSNTSSMDLPQVFLYERNNTFTFTDESSRSDKKNIDTVVCNDDTFTADDSWDPGLQAIESAQPELCPGNESTTSVSQDSMNANRDYVTHFSFKQSSSSEPMVTEHVDSDLTIMLTLPTEEPISHNASSSASPTNSAPAFRRQLSKRKSDNFEAFLPESVQLEHDGEDEEVHEDDDFYSVGSAQGRRSDPCTPTTPKTRRLENYDPYQIFEVQHTPCLILTVRVIRGRNITLGFQDYYDTPDPYVKLLLRSSPEGRKTTTVKENDPNPEWNESFTFYINFTQSNVLDVSLMESNSLWFDQKVGTVYYDIINIREMDKPHIETFVFNKISQVDIEFKLEFDRNPTLRYSLCLSSQEKEFIEWRKERTLEGIRRLLGEEDGPLNIDEVPTIAVIGSGGGFRAMTGYSGVFKALSESGVLDCTMYAGGLSGSSWLLSTLYSHPKWPNLDMSEFLDELKYSIDKSLLRFLNASTMYSYLKFMIQKRKDGQPVSFTDIFGRMVGETLLKDRMDATLSDQREKIKGGAVPMPLYTCVHVKKDVPARSFQEWVEFSPYEIGLPKYGTFMDSELFGSKFFMGKLVKQYKEQPLHFLQGIWGSAFCILFKRLLEDNRRIDPVEMVRQEMGKQLDEAGQESSSDCSDDEFDDSSDSIDGSVLNNENGDDTFHEVTTMSSPNSNESVSQEGNEKDSTGNALTERKNSNDAEEGLNNKIEEIKEQQKLHLNSQSSNDGINIDENEEDDSAYEGEEEDCEEDDDIDESELANFHSQRILKRGSVEMKRARENQHSSKDSASPDNDLTQEHIEVSQLPANPVIELSQQNLLSGHDLDQSYDRKKSVNWGACPTLGKKVETSETKQKRQAFISGTSARKSRSGSKSYWNQLLKKVFESNSWELLSTRRGRAAVIHNFMRGLSLHQSYPLSPFTPVEERVKAGDEFDGNFEMHPTNVKHIYIVDAGLTFNSPFPLVLRPQREVDIILSFDFSARDADNSQPFKELLLAEKWARLNRLPFPPIDTSVFEKEGMKELYIFRHPTDPHCPIVFHFVLVNQKFKYYKKPGVPRETKEEFDFAEFDIFDDPKAAYSTFNFTYPHKNFEQLSQLMEFNTLLHIDDIKEVIKEVIKKKREGPPRLPIQSKDIKLLRMKSVQEMRKLRRFITRMESRSSLYAGTSPSTPFFTPTCNYEASINPFFPRSQQEDSLSPSSDNTFSTPTDRLSESFSRNTRAKKHLHPNDIFSEFEEINYLHSTEKNMRKSSLSPNSSSYDSVFDMPPDNPGQASSTHQMDSSKNHQQSLDICDGQYKQVSAARYESLEHTIPGPDISIEADNTSHADHSCINTSHELKSDVSLIQNTSKDLLLPLQIKPLNTIKYNKTHTDSSGYGSLGGGVSTEGLRTDNITDISEQRTPLTGTFSIDSTTSEKFGSGSSDKVTAKGKQKHDSPPNPFFSKASYMRPSQSSSTSLNSSSSLTGSDNGSGRIRTPGGLLHYHLSSSETSQSSNSSRDSESNKLGRLNSRTPRLSPLVLSSNNNAKYQPNIQSLPSPATPEIFSLAPEAFKTDGTPVFDSQQAKMYYESAKSKRKVFRRQSTVSSLNSISLEESRQVCCDQTDRNSDSCHDDNQVTPNKKKMSHSDSHFKTCDENTGPLPEPIGKVETLNTLSPQTVQLSTDYEVAFDISDLSQFTGVSDIEDTAN